MNTELIQTLFQTLQLTLESGMRTCDITCFLKVQKSVVVMNVCSAHSLSKVGGARAPCICVNMFCSVCKVMVSPLVW